MPKLKIDPKKIKHTVEKNDNTVYDDYIIKIGDVELHYGDYRMDMRWAPSLEYPMFKITKERTFKTAYQCKKYMLECVAKWINKNIDLSFDTNPYSKIRPRHPWIHS